MDNSGIIQNDPDPRCAGRQIVEISVLKSFDIQNYTYRVKFGILKLSELFKLVKKALFFFFR